MKLNTQSVPETERLYFTLKSFYRTICFLPDSKQAHNGHGEDHSHVLLKPVDMKNPLLEVSFLLNTTGNALNDARQQAGKLIV